jgi:hypothetical protein
VVQVRDQVVGVLYASRVPHERLGDAYCLALESAGLDVSRGGWRVLGEALGEMVAYGETSLTEAETAGESMLRGNAIRLHKL